MNFLKETIHGRLTVMVLDNHNVPIGAIQRILGHENRTTTEIYLHSMGNPERQAMVIFEQASETNPMDESLTQSLPQP
ncbi:MAG: hypothetical protein ACLFUU_11925 [Desulfobacteraceae bacterium]